MKVLKRWKKTIGLLLVIMLFLSAVLLKGPFYYQARSYVVMYVFSKYEEKKSLLEELNISIEIPGGSSTTEKDWYPFVMVFNDHQGFSQHMDRDLSLTVLYNFGAFKWNMSSSNYFLEGSPYYNSFYGEYLVKDNSEGKFGFTPEGEVELSEVFAVPEYDYKHLVLGSLGCPEDKLKMEILSYNLKEDVQYAGYNGWSQIDAFLLVNSPAHKFKGDRRAYIQYGNPLRQSEQEDFEMMITLGRIYVRYFAEFDSTVFLYILTPKQDTLEKCDDEILSKTKISN